MCQAERIGVRSGEGPVACRRLLRFGRSGAAPWPGESIPPPKNGVASRPLEVMLPPARAQLDRGRDTITWRYTRKVAMYSDAFGTSNDIRRHVRPQALYGPCRLRFSKTHRLGFRARVTIDDRSS